MTPTLFTEDLILLPATTASEHQVSMLNDPSNTRFSEQRHRTHSRQSCQEYLDTFNGHVWEMQFGKTKSFVGMISAGIDEVNNVAEMSIMLDYYDQNLGYGTQAWEVVCDWLFQSGIRKIEAGTMAVNTGMIRVLEKLGFSVEGTRPKHFLLDGKEVDLVYFGKLNDV